MPGTSTFGKSHAASAGIPCWPASWGDAGGDDHEGGSEHGDDVHSEVEC